jgi:hypothetical protein
MSSVCLACGVHPWPGTAFCFHKIHTALTLLTILKSQRTPPGCVHMCIRHDFVIFDTSSDFDTSWNINAHRVSVCNHVPRQIYTDPSGQGCPGEHCGRRGAVFSVGHKHGWGRRFCLRFQWRSRRTRSMEV